MAEENKITVAMTAFKELVGLVDTKLRATIIVGLVIWIVLVSRENSTLHTKMNKVEEERRKSEVAIQKELYEKLLKAINPRIEAMSQKVDSSTGKVDSVTTHLGNTLNVLDKNIKKKGIK